MSRPTSAFSGSIFFASSKSSIAAAPAPSVPDSKRHAARRASALRCPGSIANAAVQSSTAASHILSFMRAAARFACAAADSGSSAMASAYESTADRYSRALNSSFPFSRSRVATHRRSRGVAPAIARRVFCTSGDAFGTERSSSGASSVGVPPSPASPIIASARDASARAVRLPTAVRPCSASRSSTVFLRGGAVAPGVTVAFGTFRMGAVESLRGRRGVGSAASAASARFRSSVHAASSETNAPTSASTRARISGSSSRRVPSACMRFLTTCAVCGKPSSLRDGRGSRTGGRTRVRSRGSTGVAFRASARREDGEGRRGTHSMYCISLCSSLTSDIWLIWSRPMSSKRLRSSSVRPRRDLRAMAIAPELSPRDTGRR